MMIKLKPEELYNRCDESVFQFDTTLDINEVEGIIGQEKALKSINFGLNLVNKGFNIYALGQSGIGKMRTIKTLLEGRDPKESTLLDWCYVHNFKNLDNPLAIGLEAGQGMVFQRDMEELIRILKVEIPKKFDSKEYNKQKNNHIDNFQQKQKYLFSKFEDEARAQGFVLRKSQSGFFVSPIRQDGELITEEEFFKFDDEKKKRIEIIGKSLHEKLEDVIREVKDGEKLLKESLSHMEKEIAIGALSFLDDLKVKYISHKKIIDYLELVKEDVITHIDDLKTQDEQLQQVPFIKSQKQENLFVKYQVNLLIDNSNKKGAPVIFESNPTYLNLLGKIEYKFHYGLALTDHLMIKAGSLHKSNGGYIVIDSLDLLKNIFSYDALKRSIKNKEIKIEDAWEQYRGISVSGMKPETIPLDIKVILVGSPYIYYLLYNLDEEYKELFKVKADFDNSMKRTKDNIYEYAEFIASVQKNEGLLPFDKKAVSRIVEYGSRMSGHQEKLSTCFSELADIIREADYWAKDRNSLSVQSEDILKALEEKIFRSNNIEEKIRELIIEDVIIIDTSNEKVGQINGLAVLDLGDYRFGKPSRITAKTYIGKAGVINIEREIKMSGKVHQKAVMIISSYLGSKYATHTPISLSASITFEQLYEMIEGDSATCAELYALLSSLSGIPIKQNFAVTGSMDQNGEVQPIGGINEKIEGFYEICKVRGLDGSHSVIMPKRNIKHLMLKQEIVEAVREDKFSIFAIEHVEEGLGLLTDKLAGSIDENGDYPLGSINYLIMKRFEQIRGALGKKKDEDLQDTNNHK